MHKAFSFFDNDVFASQPSRLAGIENLGSRQHFRFNDRAARAHLFLELGTSVVSRSKTTSQVKLGDGEIALHGSRWDGG